MVGSLVGWLVRSFVRSLVVDDVVCLWVFGCFWGGGGVGEGLGGRRVAYKLPCLWKVRSDSVLLSKVSVQSETAATTAAVPTTPARTVGLTPLSTSTKTWPTDWTQPAHIHLRVLQCRSVRPL